MLQASASPAVWPEKSVFSSQEIVIGLSEQETETSRKIKK
jgi:hypothetical protein